MQIRDFKLAEQRVHAAEFQTTTPQTTLKVEDVIRISREKRTAYEQKQRKLQKIKDELGVGCSEMLTRYDCDEAMEKFAEPDTDDVVAALLQIRQAGVNIRIGAYSTIFIDKDGELIIGHTADLKTIRKFLSSPK